jgi:hypothetical protein
VRMGFRVLAAVALVAVTATACTGNSSNETTPTPTPSTSALVSRSEIHPAVSPSTTLGSLPVPVATTGYCGELGAAANRLNAAQAALYNGGTGAQQAVDTIVAELRKLQTGAPAEIKTALAHMITGFGQARDLLVHPTDADKRKLTQIATSLSADGEKITAYVTAKCKQS